MTIQSRFFRPVPDYHDALARLLSESEPTNTRDAMTLLEHGNKLLRLELDLLGQEPEHQSIILE